MSDWYQPTDWYSPLNNGTTETEFPGNTEKENKKGLQKRRWKRAVCLILSAAVLLAGSAAVFMKNRLVKTARDSGFSVDQYGDPAYDSTEDLPENFSEFFSSYYTKETAEPVEINIPASEERDDFLVSIAAPADEELTMQELYSLCSASVVGIYGYTDSMVGYNWGSGIILSEDGIILTNTHVINNCDRAEVALSDDSKLEARLIGADAVSDIALLKIEAENLVPAVFGDSTLLTVGEKVAAIGNPLGDSFNRTLTDGIISAIDRDVTYNSRNMTLLQTNVALNEGNSGGALYNMHGQVIGITNMKMISSYSSIEGIGFAIPSSTAVKVVDSLMKYGEVRGRPSIGITVGQIPQNIGEHYSLPEGIYVAAVTEGTDAEKQGICEGDVITAVNGIPVTLPDEVNEIKNELSVGDVITFTVWHDGSITDVNVTLMDTNDVYH